MIFATNGGITEVSGWNQLRETLAASATNHEQIPYVGSDEPEGAAANRRMERS